MPKEIIFYIPLSNLILVFMLLILSGCASTPQSDSLLKSIPSNLPVQHELVDIPFYPQKLYQCGPAALATMLKSNMINVTPSELVSKIYLPERKGSLQLEMISTTRRYGLIPYLLQPKLEEILAEVNAGRPVLVFQNLGFLIFPQWHYAVVVGYDLTKQEIILRSGTEQRHITSIFDFEKSWLRAGYWSMLTLIPGEIPIQPNEWNYVKAVAGLERLGKWQALKKAYKSGLQIWPNSLELNIGMGNYYYQNKNLNLAKKFYRYSIKVNPKYSPAYNNLAQVLYEQAKYSKALIHVKRAIEIGGRHIQQYKKTMQLIRKKITSE